MKELDNSFTNKLVPHCSFKLGMRKKQRRNGGKYR